MKSKKNSKEKCPREICPPPPPPPQENAASAKLPPVNKNDY